MRFTLDVAEADGTLAPLGSTYWEDNDAIYDGLIRPGMRLVTFAPMLKYGAFPLATLLDHLIKQGEDSFGQPVEIDFAVRLAREPAEISEFGVLQIRPLVLSRETEQLRMDNVDPARLIAQSTEVLGNGRIGNLCDVVVVNSHRFERGHSQEVARLVAYFNAKLAGENRPYLLIGVGRWGSNEVARHSHGVKRDLGRARNRRGGLPRLSRHTFAGQPFFPEPHRVPGGIFHRQSRSR